jgi:hypothetical protein
MNIRNIPADYGAFERFNREYEATNYRFKHTNQRVGAATRELFVSWFPRPLAPLVRSTIYALLDAPLLEAFGFPRPSLWMRVFVPRILRFRGQLAGLLPARKQPRLRTQMRHPAYPRGYTIEELGPPERS